MKTRIFGTLTIIMVVIALASPQNALAGGPADVIDLSVLQNAIGTGVIPLGDSFEWIIELHNFGGVSAEFLDGERIFVDELPTGNIEYSLGTIIFDVGISNTEDINCNLIDAVITCSADGGDVTFGGHTTGIELQVLATPILTGIQTFKNPPPGNLCIIDPDDVVVETSDSPFGEFNNNCVQSIAGVEVIAPEFRATKSSTGSGGPVSAGEAWEWSVKVINTGSASAAFFPGEVLLRDNLPTSGLSYGVPSVSSSVDVTNAGNLTCSIGGNVLECKAVGAKVTMADTSSEFVVKFNVTATVDGSYSHPEVGGECLADPDDLFVEGNETDNDCVSRSQIFADGFERGNLVAWSGVKGAEIGDGFANIAACKLCVVSGNPLDGNYSLKVRVVNNKPHYLSDITPADEPVYRSRFLLKLAKLKMANGNKIKLLQGRDGKKKAFILQLRRKNDKFFLRGLIKTDGGKMRKTKWFKVGKAKTSIEVDWQAAESVGNHNGHIYLYKNGVLKRKKLNVNNDLLAIDAIRFGITTKLKPAYNISGFFLLDSFVSDSVIYIGP